VITLLVLQGPDKGKRFELPDRPSLIGRESPNVRLEDTTCSRKHAELRPAAYGDRWTIRDMGSSNGTWVNGQRVYGQPVTMKLGDQLRVGKTLLLFGAQPGVSTSPAARVNLAGAESGMDSAIINTLPSNEDSIVLAVPEPAAAAMGNLKILYRLSAALGSQFNVDQVLDVVMDLIFETVKADRGIAMLYHEETGELIPRVVRRRDEETASDGEPGTNMLEDDPITAEPIHASRTIINHVVQTGEGVLSSNAMADKRFSAGKSVHDLGIRSALCVPIKVRRLDMRVSDPVGDSNGRNGTEDNELLGVLYIDSSVRNYTYSVEQLRLLTAIGLQAGLALQNAKLYRQGLQAERMAAIGETTAALSHSIKNILQALRGGANVVEMGMKREDLNQLRKGWEVVERNLGRIYNLTLNLLAFSKPRKPQKVMVQPRVLIQECLELLAPLATARGVMAVADVASDQPAVPLDADGIHQVLMNLLTNALEAIEEDEGGLIRVVCRYREEQKRTIIQVIDNGKGIHRNMVPHLFELFHSTKGNRGTGLGLPVARKIVEEHGGTLEISSKPGEGTKFTIDLPASPDQETDPGITNPAATSR
jgi:signal transduction histidine kinase